MGGELDMNGCRRLRAPALALLGAVVALSSGLFGSEAEAQRSIQIAQAKRTATVTVYVGKSEDVRTESSFVELTVGDREIADVKPADRPLALDPRQEERYDAGVRLCR